MNRDFIIAVSSSLVTGVVLFALNWFFYSGADTKKDIQDLQLAVAAIPRVDTQSIESRISKLEESNGFIVRRLQMNVDTNTFGTDDAVIVNPPNLDR